MCSMECRITDRIYGSRSTKPTRRVLPIMSLRLCTCWAFALRRSSATWAKPSCMFHRVFRTTDTSANDRWHPEHQAWPRSLGRDSMPSRIDQTVHCYCLVDAAQAGELSAPECSCGSWVGLNAHFILDWLQSVELRRRAHAGLNKGEARMHWPGLCS